MEPGKANAMKEQNGMEKRTEEQNHSWEPKWPEGCVFRVVNPLFIR